MKHFTIIILCLLTMQTYAQPDSKSRKDVNYAADDREFHMLDIYLPEIDRPEYPVVIAVYGSAWLSNNSKRNINHLAKPLLDAGFAVIAPNHRSSNDAKFPAQINDIKAVIRFVRAKSKAYKLDTSFIAITGFSSGGHLAALTGTSVSVGAFSVGSESVNLEGNVGEFTTFGSSVDAVVDWFGPTDFLVMDSCGSSMNHNASDSPESNLVGGAIQKNKNKVALANPVTYVNSNNPPFLILHGDEDPLVPHCQSEILFNALQKAGVKSKYVLVPGGKHGPGLFEEKYYSLMVDFLKEIKDK